MTDSSPIIIREMQIDEEEKIRTIFKRNLWFVDRIAFIACFNTIVKEIKTQNNATCLIAEENGTILGTMSLHIKDIKSIRNGFIDAVAIDKNTRGKGIGKRLLDANI